MYATSVDARSRDIFLVAIGAILILASLSIQLSWFPVTTSDYTAFVQNWFTILQTHAGLSAFSQPFSDYAPLYLYFLKVLTSIPLDSLTSSKALSLLGNIAIAALAMLIARDCTGRRSSRARLFLVFAIFLCIPTLAVNASLWGQSDSLYAAPLVASFYLLLRDRPLAASVLFGVAVSIKIQAIFFVPILIGYLLRERTRAWNLFVPPAIFVLTVLPTAFTGEFWYWLLIYLKQSGEYPYLSVSSPSIFAFVNNLPLSSAAQTSLFWLGIVLALACAALIAYAVQSNPQTKSSAVAFFSFLSVLVIPYLLPRMHERYFFLADIFSCLYFLFEPRRWYLAVLVVLASLLSYMPYLSSQVDFLSFAEVDLRIPAAILLISICLSLFELSKTREAVPLS